MPIYRINERIITPSMFPWGHETLNFAYASKYPPAYSVTYIKSTTRYSTSYYAHNAMDPSKSFVGSWGGTQWISQNGVNTNQRFHVDLGEAFAIQAIYYQNGHSSGTNTNSGVKDVVIQGSNDVLSFNEVTFASDFGWTDIWTGVFEEHIASNVSDPKYIELTNTTPYRYYAFKFANNYGHSGYMTLRHMELRTKERV